MRSRVLLSALVLTLASLTLHAQGPSDPAYGLSTDFRNWLSANGYGSYNFQRSDVAGGAYGGRETPAPAAAIRPPSFFLAPPPRASVMFCPSPHRRRSFR